MAIAANVLIKHVTVSTNNNYQTARLDFAIADEKGRPVGAVITTWEADTREYDPATDSGYTLMAVRPGRLFVASVQAARNGNQYGAAQRGEAFSNEADRAVWVINQTAAMKARYAKKYAAK